MKAPNRGQLLDRIPGGEHAVTEAAMAPPQSLRERRRIRRAASNGGSMKTSPRFSLGGNSAPKASQPDRSCTSTWGRGETPPQGRRVLRMQFAAGQPVVRTQHRSDQGGRAGIEPELLPPSPDSVPKPATAIEASAGSRCPPRRSAGPRSASRSYRPAPAWVSSTKYGAGFARERIKQRDQQRVLEAIGEIAGMVGVAIIHRRTALPAPPAATAAGR